MKSPFSVLILLTTSPKKIDTFTEKLDIFTEKVDTFRVKRTLLEIMILLLSNSWMIANQRAYGERALHHCTIVVGPAPRRGGRCEKRFLFTRLNFLE